MSSLVRRLAIRAMKRAGYEREKWIIVKNARGEPQLQNVKRGGEITDPDDTPIGRHWPDLIPARAKMPTVPVKRNPVVRAFRRTARSKAWLEARARTRAASVDTHAKRCDVERAQPARVGSAVPKADAQ